MWKNGDDWCNSLYDESTTKLLFDAYNSMSEEKLNPILDKNISEYVDVASKKIRISVSYLGEEDPVVRIGFEIDGKANYAPDRISRSAVDAALVRALSIFRNNFREDIQEKL
jgi:hypothetical protein